MWVILEFVSLWFKTNISSLFKMVVIIKIKFFTNCTVSHWLSRLKLKYKIFWRTINIQKWKCYCVWPKLVIWRFNVVKMKKKILGSFGSKPKMVQSLTLTVLRKIFFRTSKRNTVMYYMTHYSDEQSTDSSLSKWNSHSLLGQSHDLYCVWDPNFYIHVSCIGKKIGMGSYCV